jgi:hypothetical protein
VVERQLPKLNVVGSIPIARSKIILFQYVKSKARVSEADAYGERG